MSQSASKAKKKAPRKSRVGYSAKQRCEAVLSVWTERRKPSEVCKELQIAWAQLNQWEDQALKGMLGALEPRQRKESARPPVLSAKLVKLLEKVEKKEEQKQSKLEERLEQLVDSAPPKKPSLPSDC